MHQRHDLVLPPNDGHLVETALAYCPVAIIDEYYYTIHSFWVLSESSKLIIVECGIVLYIISLVFTLIPGELFVIYDNDFKDGIPYWEVCPGPNT